MVTDTPPPGGRCYRKMEAFKMAWMIQAPGNAKPRLAAMEQTPGTSKMVLASANLGEGLAAFRLATSGAHIIESSYMPGTALNV